MKCLVLFLSLFVSFPSFAANVVSITTTTLPNGTVGTSYTATINVTGGCTPYRWTITGTLPAGIQSVIASKGISLTLSGTPTTAGTYNFGATVTRCGWHRTQISYTVVIQPIPVHVVNLSWNASESPNLAGYNMYRAPNGVNWQRINSGGLIASTWYSDSAASNGSTYYYAATAVNISGEESAKSTPIQVIIP
jgi:hypothetical protein